MKLFKPIKESDASLRVKKIFQDIKKTRKIKNEIILGGPGELIF